MAKATRSVKTLGKKGTVKRSLIRKAVRTASKKTVRTASTKRKK